MKLLIAAVAVLVALTVGVQAQTPDIDALRARAEQGDAEAQYNPEGLSALLNHYGPR
jgi:hypothetical protein